MTFWGADIIQDSTSGTYYMVDLNYAPSFHEVENSGAVIFQHIMNGLSQKWNRPYQNSILLPDLKEMNRGNTIIVFDIDGTITNGSARISSEMRDLLLKLKERATVGIVSGGTLQQIETRVGETANQVDYIFCENSCQTLHKGTYVDVLRMDDLFTREEMTEMIDWALIYISKLKLPFKRGLFIDYRESLINISPAGRWSACQDERAAALKAEWVAYDKEHKVRFKMVNDMKDAFGHWDKLEWVIGGYSGFDVFPKGWNKSLITRFCASFQHCFYFGDKTDPEMRGNDWPMYSHETTFGFSVKNPRHTQQLVESLFF